MSERLVHDTEASRYLIYVDEELAGMAEYTVDGQVVDLVHTEVNPSMGGRGIGSRLVAHVLEDIRAQGLEVRPFCSFVAAYIRDHPEFTDLVADPQRFGIKPPEVGT
jgi:predicted GNAT family acetyltransferase